ncbi:MAG: UPF0175 family protein [Azoarcus sp.]|nr:UPF0175 family protein [Azoarcus sp.]
MILAECVGVHTALAARLFQDGMLTSSRAAWLARMSLAEFLEYVSAQGISVTR